MGPDLGQEPSRQIAHQAHKVLRPAPVFRCRDVLSQACPQDLRPGVIGDRPGEMADRLDLEFQDLPFLPDIRYLEDVFRAAFSPDVEILVPLAGKFPGHALDVPESKDSGLGILVRELRPSGLRRFHGPSPC